MSDCKKFVAWMMDAAMGELDPRGECELLAHVRECASCREAYQHARELANFVDRGLESLVAGEPSAQFGSRLRARIAEERSAARTNWFTWRPAAAALALAALIAAVVLLRTPQPTISRPTPAQLAPNALSSAKLPASQLRRRGQSHERAALAATVVSRGQFAASRVAALRASVQREPEVLVPPGQLKAIKQFAAEINAGHIGAKELIAADARAKKPLDIAPLEIAPLEKPQSGTDPAFDGQESPRHP